MARVTVEDCMEVVENNRFKLCILAAKRTRAIASGAYPTVSQDNDKQPVIALREIAERTIDIAHLEETIIQGLQKKGKFDVLDGEVSTSNFNEIDSITDEGFVDFDADVEPADDLTFDDSSMSFDDDNLDIED